MFSQLLTKQEQMIYQRLKNGSYAIDYFSKVTLSPFDQTIDEKLFPWLVESHNQRTSITMTLSHSPVQMLDCYATLLQKNPHLQLCWYLIQHPYSRLCELKKSLYFSTSTIQRQSITLSAFLASYKLQLSYNHDPVIKGCEVQLRWLAWGLSLIFDPPFNWYDNNELYQRLKEVQQMRIQAGQTLNHCTTKELIYLPELPYQISERGWEYLVKQILGLAVPTISLTSSSIFHFFQNEGQFFQQYQQHILQSSSHQSIK